MPDQSIYERLDATQRELASIVEELGSAIYEAIERETLNRVAIAAGLDHTVESTKVIEGLGEALRHERDVNRELRRQVAGLTAALDRRDASPVLSTGVVSVTVHPGSRPHLSINQEAPDAR